MKTALSGSQTVGPYFAIGMEALCVTEVPAPAGERITVEGRLLDGNGAPIWDGLLELWQADAEGRYASGAADSTGAAMGFARVKMDANGGFRFTTVKPGSVAYDETRMQAPHVVVLVFMRGLLRNLVTRMYFPDEALNAADPVLACVPESRRHTLIAKRDEVGGSLRWDIVTREQEAAAMDETVFFAW